jgi:type IV pilus assembly protein PilO
MKLNAPALSGKVPSFDMQGLIEDFRTLDTRDPGNWPILPKIIILAAVFVAVLVAGWWFDWRDQLEQLEAKQSQEEQLRQEYVSKKRQAVNLDEYRKQLNEIDRAFGTLLKQLPNKSEMEALLVDINQAGLGRGLQFDLFKPGNEATKDFYAELPINISLSGNYHDLGAFAGDLAKLSRIVTLSEINLDGSKDQQRLKLEAVATTFRYLDEEEVAKMRQQKADQKKGRR